MLFGILKCLNLNSVIFRLCQNSHINKVTATRSSCVKFSVFVVQRILLTLSCHGPLRKLIREIAFKLQSWEELCFFKHLLSFYLIGHADSVLIFSFCFVC